MQKLKFDMDFTQLVCARASVATAVSTPADRLVYKPDLGTYVQYESKRRFVRPIPFEWVYRCNRLGGKTTQVAIALWFLVGVKQSMYFKLTKEAVDLAACSRSALEHGLVQLEKAGLIETERRRGARPQIRMIEVH